jgi:hypothetical protein
VNSYLYDYRADVEAAGLQYPLQGQYYVAVDSGHSEFTGRPFAGRYLLHSWINDVTPPLATMTTTTIAAGRPTISARTLDLQAGVDPLSLVIAYGRVLIGAAAYDPVAGFAIFPLPASVARLKAGKLPVVFAAGDFQEDKNVDQAGEISAILPNTSFVTRKLRVVDGPTITWLFPDVGECAAASTRLLVVAGATRDIDGVAFSVDGTPISTTRTGNQGLFATTWRSSGLGPGPHTLQATITDADGARASATRAIRACRTK